MKQKKFNLFLALAFLLCGCTLSIFTLSTKTNAQTKLPERIQVGNKEIVLKQGTTGYIEANEISGNGWTYVKSDNKLYLNNCTLDNAISANGDLNVVVSGTNTIPYIGLDSNGKISLSGNGTLNVNFSDKKQARMNLADEFSISNCTLNINANYYRNSDNTAYSPITAGNISMNNCNISINAHFKKKSAYLIFANNLSIKKSKLKLNGNTTGIYTSSLNMADSSLKLKATHKGSYGLCVYTMGEDQTIKIKNSALDITSCGTSMEIDSQKTTIVDSKLNLVNNGTDKDHGTRVTSNQTGLYLLTFKKFILKNSTLNAKGHLYAGIFNGGQLEANHSKVTFTGKNRCGLYVIRPNKLLLQNKSNLTVSGKKYGVELYNRSTFMAGKLKATIKGSTLSLKGGKKAINRGSLSNGKKLKITKNFNI